MAAEYPEKTVELRSALEEMMKRRGSSVEDDGSGLVVGPDEAARLEALGYVATGSRPPAPEPGKDLKDPKDVVHLKDLLEEARALKGAGSHREAMIKLDELLTADPENFAANNELARIQQDTGMLLEAEASLSRLAELRPGHPDVPLRLARVQTGLAQRLAAGGRRQEAARKLDRAARNLDN